MFYLIVYQLDNASEEKYEKLWRALYKIQAIRRQRSVWHLISGNFPNSQSVFDYLAGFIDTSPGKDKLLVAAITLDVVACNDLKNSPLEFKGE